MPSATPTTTTNAVPGATRHDTAGNAERRSKQYPQDLAALWRELDGKVKYPNDDLVEWGKVGDLPSLKGAS